MITGADREAGYTLAEVLVAVVILAIAVVSVVGALGSSLFVSRAHRDIVTSDATVRRYAEQLTAAPYVACATPPAAPTGNHYPAISAVPTGYVASITAIEYGTTTGSTLTFSPSCPVPDQGTQRITLEARRATGTGVQTIHIVKRAS